MDKIVVNLGNEETLKTTVKDLNYIPEYKKYELERQLNEAKRQSNEADRENYINELKQRVLNNEFDGAGISSIEKTGTSGLVDTYTITYDDGRTETFNVTNGEKGDTGNTGPSNILSIGTVTSGENASATITGSSPSQILNLVLPKGEKGDKGDKGAQGDKGEQGIQGIQGIQGNDGAAATIQVGTVTTGEAGSQASITNTGTNTNAIFDFIIPKGDTGEASDYNNLNNLPIKNLTGTQDNPVTLLSFTSPGVYKINGYFLCVNETFNCNSIVIINETDIVYTNPDVKRVTGLLLFGTQRANRSNTPDPRIISFLAQYEKVEDEWVLDETTGGLKDIGDCVLESTMGNYINIFNEKFEEMTYELDELRSNQIEGTATGKTINVKDSSKMKAELSLYGESKQETTTGKNLFNYVDNLKTNIGGLVSTINSDGSITTTGIPSQDYSTILSYLIDDELENGETYTLSQATLQKLKLYAQINIIDKNGGPTQHIALNVKTSSSFTVDTINKQYLIKIQTGLLKDWGNSSLTITNYYQLEKGLTTTEFEPYTGGQPSPSPDYPQEIVNIEAKNLFNNISTTPYIASGITTNFSNNTYTLNGTATKTYAELTTSSTPLSLKNGTYTISIDNPTPFKVHLKGVYKDDTIFEYAIQSNSISKTFTLQKETKRAYIYISGLSIGQVLNDVQFKFQLEKGSVATEIVPYGCIRETICGKNLAQLENGSLWDSNGVERDLTNSVRTKFIKFKKDMVITPSIISELTTRYLQYILYDKNKKLISLNKFTNYTSISTLDDNVEYIRFKMTGPIDRTMTIDDIDFQVELGSTATSYEPYKSQTLDIFISDIKLCSVGDVKYELYTQNGHVYLKKNIDEVVLDGSEEWIENPTYKGIFMLTKSNIVQKYNNVYVQSNYFLGVSNDNFSSNISTIDNSTTNYGNTRLFIAFRKYQNNLNDFKTWLSTHPVTVQYQRATPSIIDLGEYSKLKTYKNITNVSNSENADMSLKYYKDMETLINNLTSAVVTLGGDQNV